MRTLDQLLEEAPTCLGPGSRISILELGWNQPTFPKRSPVAHVKSGSVVVLGFCSNKHMLHTSDGLGQSFSDVHANPPESCGSVCSARETTFLTHSQGLLPGAALKAGDPAGK